MLDAMALSRMPLRKTVSVVADTTAILQGGLDFVALHLAPAARIIIPAIVHMEILNFSDRYLRQRRKDTHGPQMVLDHVLSQGGQRVLLRLERDHQLERARLGADPLRGIIQPDSDAEDRNLGLQHVQRSFADRLILETAIQRRNRVEANHPVMLMTADQGLARMALAEGIEPIFFDADGVRNLFGTTLSGVTFRPFTNGPQRTHAVALTSVLWELAVAFGQARVIGVDSKHALEVAAIGDGLSWQPYHSSDDLLWTKVVTGEASPNSQTPAQDSDPEAAADPIPAAVEAKASYVGSYTFSPASMLTLMQAVGGASLPDGEAMDAAGVGSAKAYEQYFRFLLAGGFAIRTGNRLEGTAALTELLQAVSSADFEDVRDLLRRVASFDQFSSRLSVANSLTAEKSGIRRNAFAPYCALAEVCCAGVRFAESGIYATPKDPSPDMFADRAIEAYDAVRKGDEFALTGAWLEYLVRHLGIHPVRARQRLSEAYQGGYVRRFFEGSTPDTRYESRTIHVLNGDAGIPSIRKINLYHGDFLMPGRATVSIRLSGGSQ